MNQFRKRTKASGDDRFCPDMPVFVVSELLHGQQLRIIRLLPCAVKFVL
jgi:hypothetical protein